MKHSSDFYLFSYFSVSRNGISLVLRLSRKKNMALLVYSLLVVILEVYLFKSSYANSLPFSRK